MTDFDRICRLVAKDLGEDVDTVHKIALFQFKQIAGLMKDPEDVRDILINKLFKFKLKTRYKNNKRLEYIAK